MDCPKIKVFINHGRVEAVYADTCLLDVEIIECAGNGYLRRFDKEYDKAEAAGLEEISANVKTIDTPWYDDEEESA